MSMPVIRLRRAHGLFHVVLSIFALYSQEMVGIVSAFSLPLSSNTSDKEYPPSPRYNRSHYPIKRELNWGDPPEYNEFWDKLYAQGELQEKAYIQDCWRLPHVDWNPSIQKWDYGGVDNEVIIVWNEGARLNFMIMTTGPTGEDWEVKFFSPIGVQQVTAQENGVNITQNFIAGDGRLYKTEDGTLRLAFLETATFFYMSYVDLEYIPGDENDEIDTHLHIKWPKVRLFAEHEYGHRSEKNWSPFIYKGMPSDMNRNLFIYSVAPHRIVYVNELYEEGLPTGTRKVHTGSSTESEREGDNLWSYGEPRGGTPAILIDTIHGPKYLTFFHSQGEFAVGWCKTYYMGAYLFDSEPPFAITHITPYPIIPPGLYKEETSGWAFKAIDYILFPVGLVQLNESIYITLGRQDREGWVVKMDPNGLVSTLEEVVTKKEVTSNKFHDLLTGALTKV